MDIIEVILLSEYKRHYADPDSLYKHFSYGMKAEVDRFKNDPERWELEVYKMQDFADNFMSDPTEPHETA